MSDGMDISICCFNRTTRQLSWAGANLPLWIIRDKQLIEIKPDRQPIGHYVTNNRFTLHTLDLMENDLVYLFSDGYPDQFGGDEDKKLSKKQLQEMLIAFNSDNLSAVMVSLKEAFDKWKGENEQVDDVTVLGVRF